MRRIWILEFREGRQPKPIWFTSLHIHDNERSALLEAKRLTEEDKEKGREWRASCFERTEK